uniref:Putative secreted protein n=1 Tax=Ixodes ricinus TaxID=34613 RepID=A0A6B0UMI2_IXORI
MRVPVVVVSQLLAAKASVRCRARERPMAKTVNGVCHIPPSLPYYRQDPGGGQCNACTTLPGQSRGDHIRGRSMQTGRRRFTNAVVKHSAAPRGCRRSPLPRPSSLRPLPCPPPRRGSTP